MVLGVSLLLFGALVVYAGLHHQSVSDVLTGKPGTPLGESLLPSDTFSNASATTGTGTAATGTSATPTAKGVGQFDGKPVANWIIPILQYARAHGWSGSVTSGYRSYADQARIYNSGVRPAAVPGTSNHEGSQFPRGAVDVSNAPQLSQILLKSPYASTLVWAGAKDPVHFSHPHGGSY